MAKKYTAGAKEHGGNLWEKDPIWLVDQAIDEAIDQVVYLLTLKGSIRTLESDSKHLRNLENNN